MFIFVFCFLVVTKAADDPCCVETNAADDLFWLRRAWAPIKTVTVFLVETKGRDLFLVETKGRDLFLVETKGRDLVFG